MTPTDRSAKLPSERSFGLLFTGAFAVLGFYALYRAAPLSVSLAWWAASCITGLITLAAPRLLTPFNKAWFVLGEWMGKIVSPVVLGMIFFGVLSPLAFVGRLMGRDELRLKRKPGESYWIERTPPGPEGESFKNQF